MMANFQIYTVMAGMVVSKLYNLFPIPSELEVGLLIEDYIGRQNHWKMHDELFPNKSEKRTDSPFKMSDPEKLRKIMIGTITHLRAENYVRNLQKNWQLTEKGISMLHSAIKDAGPGEAKETLISKIRETLSQPSLKGVPSLTQIMIGLS